jgi:hypothetical protein
MIWTKPPEYDSLRVILTSSIAPEHHYQRICCCEARVSRLVRHYSEAEAGAGAV